MLYKKRWSDGLDQSFDDGSFESKFYCFGGDGGGGGGGSIFGGGGGGGGTNKPSYDDRNDRAPGGGSGIGRADVMDPRGRMGGSFNADQARKDALADSIQERVSQAIFDSGFQGRQGAADGPSLGDLSSATGFMDRPTTDISGRLGEAFGDVNKPSYDIPAYDIPTLGLNEPTKGGGYSTPNVNQGSGVNFGLENPFGQGGTLTPNVGSGSIGFEYTAPTDLFSGNGRVSFNSSPITSSGIMSALTQGMNNYQPTQTGLNNPTSTAFLDTFTNVFGNLPGETTYQGNLAKKGNTYTSASRGGITSTRQQPSIYDQIAKTGKSFADMMGIASLYD